MKILTDDGVNYLVEKIKANILNFVSSSTITKIEVVDTLPDREEEGVLYLVKEANAPTPEYITNPVMKMGTLDISTGAEEPSTNYCIPSDYIYIKGKNTLTITNDISSSMRVVCYDANKSFMTNWFTDTDGSLYSYKRLASGEQYTFPDDAYYIKFRIASTEIVNVTITYE